jgi:hypothetical protein
VHAPEKSSTEVGGRWSSVDLRRSVWLLLGSRTKSSAPAERTLHHQEVTDERHRAEWAGGPRA